MQDDLKYTTNLVLYKWGYVVTQGSRNVSSTQYISDGRGIFDKAVYRFSWIIFWNRNKNEPGQITIKNIGKCQKAVIQSFLKVQPAVDEAVNSDTLYICGPPVKL